MRDGSITLTFAQFILALGATIWIVVEVVRGF